MSELSAAELRILRMTARAGGRGCVWMKKLNASAADSLHEKGLLIAAEDANGWRRTNSKTITEAGRAALLRAQASEQSGG